MDNSVSVAVGIAIIGWLANHWLSLRAQEKKFLNDIKNDTRLKISEAIRDYQEWLSGLENYFQTLELTLKKPQLGLPIDWAYEYSRFHEVTKASPKMWNWLLEEHRILFPETTKVRVILQRRDFEISHIILWFQMEFWSHRDNPQDDLYNKFQILNEVKRWTGYIGDQSCLVHDLRIYLQNRTLSDITGNQVPERKPAEGTLCRISKGLNDMLEVVDGQGIEIEHQKLPFSPVDLWQYPID